MADIFEDDVSLFHIKHTILKLNRTTNHRCRIKFTEKLPNIK